MSPAKLVTGFVSIALVLMAPGPARSQTCTGDADCGKGFRCQSDALATPAVATCRVVDGGACAPVSVPAVPTSSCQAADCTTDADCGADMACNRRVATSCTGTAPATPRCDPNGGCDAGVELVPTPVICTDTVIAKCAYRWELPCNADVDCGTGFICQPTNSGTCTGSAGAPTTGGTSAGTGGGSGAAPPDRVLDAGPAVTCTVVSSYPGRCLAKTITCVGAGDCPAGWTCSAEGTGTTTVATPTAPTGAPVADPAPIDAGAALLPPVLTNSICRAPSTSGSYGERGGSDGTQTPVTVGLGADGGAAKGSNTPPTPTVPPSGGAQTPEQQPVASTTSGGGCSVGRGSDHGLASGLGLLALFALVASGRRRFRGNRR